MRWTTLLARAALIALCLLLCGCATTCGGPKPRPPEPPTAEGAPGLLGPWGIPGTTVATGSDAPAPAQPPADLGRETAKRAIAKTAAWIGSMGFAVVGLGVLGMGITFLAGGIAFRRWFLIIGIGAGCWFAQFTLLAHGWFISETISWGLIVTMYGAMGWAIVWAAQMVYARWMAQRLARKHAADGAEAKDAIALLPVPQKVRSALDEAWNLARAGQLPADLERLLVKHKLPVPAPKL